MPKTITMQMDAGSIDGAIAQLEQYRDSLKTKAQELRNKVGQAIADESRAGFGAAPADTTIIGGNVPAVVSVGVKDDGNTTVVTASGEDAIWAEFGAGVYYNGAAGTSPNPFVAENGLPYTIGSYGKGLGRRKTWSFKDSEGNKHVTHGTPASMPMYKADVQACMNAADMAREVFGND